MKYALVRTTRERAGEIIKLTGDFLSYLQSDQDTLVNGRKVSKVTEVALGDHVRVGVDNYAVVAHDHKLHADKPTLFAISGKHAGKVAVLDERKKRVRADEHSAVFSLEGPRVKLESPEGDVLLNGISVLGVINLYPGSHVQIGDTHYVVLPKARAEPEPEVRAPATEPEVPEQPAEVPTERETRVVQVERLSLNELRRKLIGAYVNGFDKDATHAELKARPAQKEKYGKDVVAGLFTFVRKLRDHDASKEMARKALELILRHDEHATSTSDKIGPRATYMIRGQENVLTKLEGNGYNRFVADLLAHLIDSYDLPVDQRSKKYANLFYQFIQKSYYPNGVTKVRYLPSPKLPRDLFHDGTLGATPYKELKIEIVPRVDLLKYARAHNMGRYNKHPLESLTPIQQSSLESYNAIHVAKHGLEREELQTALDNLVNEIYAEKTKGIRKLNPGTWTSVKKMKDRNRKI